MACWCCCCSAFVQVDVAEQEEPRRRVESRLHQVAVHDDPVVGGESTRTLEALRHPGLWRASGRLTSRVVASTARHPYIALRRTEGKEWHQRDYRLRRPIIPLVRTAAATVMAFYYAPPLIGGALSDAFVWRLSDVSLSCTSGVTREQRYL